MYSLLYLYTQTHGPTDHAYTQITRTPSFFCVLNKRIVFSLLLKFSRIYLFIYWPLTIYCSVHATICSFSFGLSIFDEHEQIYSESRASKQVYRICTYFSKKSCAHYSLVKHTHSSSHVNQLYFIFSIIYRHVTPNYK